MIKNLINSLLYPDMGKFAFLLYNAMRSGELSLSMFSELIIALHRLSLCSYYEIEDIEFGDVSGNYRYFDPVRLCDNGMSFALLCLTKIVKDNKAEKPDGLVVIEDCTLNVREVIAKLELAAQTIGDEDELTEEWIDNLNAFITWMPDKDTDFRIALLDVMDTENADIIFGLCTMHKDVSSPERFKKYQTINPEDFFTVRDIREYHAQRIHSIYCYSFLERADNNENIKVFDAENKIEKAQSIKELLFAFAEEDVYLNSDVSFPYTVYLLLTNKTINVQLKKIPAEQEILTRDQDIPDELKGVFSSAKKGDVKAQSELASRYLSGSMLPKDDYRAVYWLKLAAEGGDAFAQTNYGIALQNGLGGLERDCTEAIEWFLKAAEKGEPVAQYHLGLAYAKGLGVKRDLREMERWIKLSADGGNIMAQLILQNGLIIND